MGNELTELELHCPKCKEEALFVFGPTQALCNTEDCPVVTFNPSLPDGGLSDAQILDLS